MTAKGLGKMYWLRKRMLLVLRNFIFILIIISLSGINVRWFVDTTTTLFVLDTSDSMKAYRDKVEEFVRAANHKKTDKDYVGVVTFGGNALVENFISKSIAFHKIETNPDSRYTNIENALTASMAIIPQNTRKRIVLITDGEENIGASNKISPSILNESMDLKVYRINRALKNEIAVDSMSLPQKVNLGQGFNITVTISSKVSGSAKLSLFSGRQKQSEQEIQIAEGINRFVFKDMASEGGFRSYRAVIESDLDTLTENNEASGYTTIVDRPSILLVEDKDGEADEIGKLLTASNMDFEKVKARSVPSSLEDILRFKSIISCNVSAENLSQGFLNSLEAYVRDFGGGFIATGGDDSFALGGYYKTPLEKILPVNMDLKGKKEIPDMSIVLIIDKSGSMTDGSGGITKLDIAKEAAARTLDSLRPKDQIGVLTFDDTNYWVVETSKADNPDKIREDIGTIRSGGGTSIIPALAAGYESIKKANTKIKHIILLTDGQAERAGYEELIGKLKADNITVSTVAVGKGSDTTLLQSIAKGADGRFYYTDEFSNIPRIFAKETFMAARAYLNNREFTPSIVNSHVILRGAAEAGLPSLLGYVAASPKDTARVVLASDEDDPILTVWQYGLGKTVAWNSDVSGKWNANYVGWGNNLKLWQNIINFTIENYEDQPVTIETSAAGSKGTVTMINREDTGDMVTKASIISPTGENSEINLYPVEPGKYEGDFELKETGAYLIKARQEKDGEVVYAGSSGLSSGYSPEYKLTNSKANFERLLKDTGATIITKPEEVFAGNPKEIFGSFDIAPYLIALALLLFMLDIAIRRLNLPLHKLEDWLDRWRGKRKIKARGKPLAEKMAVQMKEEIKVEVTSEVKQSREKEKSRNEILDTSELLKKKKRL